MEITPEFISELRYEDSNRDLIRKLLYIVDTEPNDLLRVCARVWLSDNACKILKDFYYGDQENPSASERRTVY